MTHRQTIRIVRLALDALILGLLGYVVLVIFSFFAQGGFS